MGSIEIKIDDQVKGLDSRSDSVAKLENMKSNPMCRICLERGVNSGDEMISPCECNGTSKFVHRSCLDNWRSVKEGFAFAHCTTCKAQFHLRTNFLEGSCWRTAKFRMLVARDVLLLFLAVQTIISMLGGLTYLCDVHGKLIKLIIHGRLHPVIFYYFFGVLLFLALLGIFGFLVHCTSSNDSTGSDSVFCLNGPTFFDCDSGSDADGDLCLLILVAVLVVIIIYAIVGIFYGIFVGSIFLQRIWKKHYHILTKRELTKEHVVEDLRGDYKPPKLDRGHEQHLRMLGLL